MLFKNKKGEENDFMSISSYSHVLITEQTKKKKLSFKNYNLFSGLTSSYLKVFFYEGYFFETFSDTR